MNEHAGKIEGFFSNGMETNDCLQTVRRKLENKTKRMFGRLLLPADWLTDRLVLVSLYVMLPLTPTPPTSQIILSEYTTLLFSSGIYI